MTAKWPFSGTSTVFLVLADAGGPVHVESEAGDIGCGAVLGHGHRAACVSGADALANPKLCRGCRRRIANDSHGVEEALEVPPGVPPLPVPSPERMAHWHEMERRRQAKIVRETP